MREAVSPAPAPPLSKTPWLWLILACVAAPLCVAQTAAAPPPDSLHARVSLISEKTGLVPGQTAWLALDFEIEDGWHLYWNGLNDTGYPPSLALDLPPGYEVGGFLWPVPVRHVSPGGILDHVYEERLTLVFPLNVPPKARPGQRLELRGTADWLICKDVCIPERRPVSLTLPVISESEQEPHAFWSGRFETTRELLPECLPSGAVKASWDENVLRLQAPGAKWIGFYPELESSPPKDLIGQGAGSGESLEMEFVALEGEPLKAQGVLEVRTPDGRKFYRLRR